jgi:polyphosphate glucokinase
VTVAAPPPPARTLAIDVGGSGMKAMVVAESGEPLSERVRVPTPARGKPEQVLAVIDELARALRETPGFDRVAIGFPGVVSDGVTHTAPHFDRAFAGYPLGDAVARRLGRPVALANDADIHGLAVIDGLGLEMMLTLGTGLGSALYIDGRAVPNLELSRHPWGGGETYEDRLGNAERKRVGDKRWNKRVREAIAQLAPIFNYRLLYVGGGNAKRLDAGALPDNVRVVESTAGLRGGALLFRHPELHGEPRLPLDRVLELPGGR